MYQVTAIYEDSEVGYGEGEGLDYAIEDCIDSIPQIYKDCADRQQVALVIRHESGVTNNCYVSKTTWQDIEIAVN